MCASKNSNATSKGTLRKTAPFVLMNLSKYMSAYVLMSTKSNVWAAWATISINDEIKAYSTIYSHHHHYRRLLHANTHKHSHARLILVWNASRLPTLMSTRYGLLQHRIKYAAIDVISTRDYTHTHNLHRAAIVYHVISTVFNAVMKI